MRLNVFILSTGCYNDYLKYLYKSIVNLFPNLSKHIYLIGDKNIIYDLDKTIDYTFFEIIDLPYPYITYFKPIYIYECINKFNIGENEYFIYLDADSIILYKDDLFWKKLLDNINNYELCFTLSTWKNIGYIENNLNKHSSTYINNKDLNYYIQGSLFFGKINKFITLYKLFYKYYYMDAKNHVIPLIYDQNIFNKIILDDNFKCNINYYGINYYNDINDDYNDSDIITGLLDTNYIKFHDKLIKYNEHKQNIFVIQKFNEYIKKDKRIFQKNIIDGYVGL